MASNTFEVIDERIRRLQGGERVEQADHPLPSHLSPWRVYGLVEECKQRMAMGASVPVDYTVYVCALAMISCKKGMVPYKEQIDAAIQLVRSAASNEHRMRNEAEMRGTIAEIQTGEGKTMVIQLASGALGLQGRKVHIMTSNTFLALRDYEQSKEYFQQHLGIRVSCVARSHDALQPSVQDFEKADIVIGTPNCFQFHLLRLGLCLLPECTKTTKPIQMTTDVAFADEADAFVLDAASCQSVLGSDMIEPRIGAQQYEAVHELGLAHSSKKMFRSSVHGSPLQKSLSKEERDQLCDSWIKANMDLRINMHYILDNGCIVVVRPFSGELAPYQRYADGVHEFLELKHRLTIGQKSLSLALSLPHTFLARYTSFLGVTGTVGNAIEQDELMTKFKVSTFHVPLHHTRRAFDLQDMIVARPKQFHGQIWQNTFANVSQMTPRPVLIVCESMAECHKLYSYIKRKMKVEERHCQEMNRPFNLALQEIKVKESRETIRSGFERAGQAGQVTIATLIAGRGIDIPLDEQSRQGRGLHVIGTFMPSSKRVERQIFGRAARNGEPGSGRLICKVDVEQVEAYQENRRRIEVARERLQDGQTIETTLAVVRRDFQARKEALFAKQQDRWFASVQALYRARPSPWFTVQYQDMIHRRSHFVEIKMQEWALLMDNLRLFKSDYVPGLLPFLTHNQHLTVGEEDQKQIDKFLLCFKDECRQFCRAKIV